MKESCWISKARAHLRTLCIEIDSRRVGSKGNQAATQYFAEMVAGFGFQVQSMAFECMDWVSKGVRLQVGGQGYEASGSPYSLGCDVRAPLTTASTEDELEMLLPGAQILLLRGDLVREQLMPKNFPFFNPERHQRVIGLLEAKKPTAIIAATSIDPGLAGGISPFPLIEDGDFDIPSVFMTVEEGLRLVERVGEQTHLHLQAQRIPSTGSNVLARRGSQMGSSLVVCAHIDSKMGSPGAIDNASGVIVLLLLAEMLKESSADHGLEIVAFNGEDYYAASGQIEYVAQSAKRWSEMRLAINLDCPGYIDGASAYTLYACPETLSQTVQRTFSKYTGLQEGEPWYQSDHSIFIQRGVPAMAITSEQFRQLSAEVTHTERDEPGLLDISKLVEIGLALSDLYHVLDRSLVR